MGWQGIINNGVFVAKRKNRGGGPEKRRRRKVEALCRRLICNFLKAEGFKDPWALKDAEKIDIASQFLNAPLTGDKARDLASIAYTIQEAGKSAETAIPTVRPSVRALPKKAKTCPTQKQIDEFYDSWEWKRLSYRAKQTLGRRCQCCGATPEAGAQINTDHVKPIRHHWELRLDQSNLQILCNDCNRGKGSWDETDWRAA
jgi:5-methylcytosine-specific restriction endonuclease McrA